MNILQNAQSQSLASVSRVDYPLVVRDLTVAYHRKPVVWDIDLEIPGGKLVGQEHTVEGLPESHTQDFR